MRLRPKETAWQARDQLGDTYRELVDHTAARWTAILRSTQPSDRPRAEQGVERAYRDASESEVVISGMGVEYRPSAAGPMIPEVLVWLESPLAGIVAAHLLERASHYGGDSITPVGKRFREGLPNDVMRSLQSANTSNEPPVVSQLSRLGTVLHNLLSAMADAEWRSVDAALWAPIGHERWRLTWTGAVGAIRTALEPTMVSFPRDAVLRGLDRLGDDGWQRDIVEDGSVRLYRRLARISLAPDEFGSTTAVALPNEPCFGPHDSPWLSLFDLLIEEGSQIAAPLFGQIEIARECGWWWPFDSAVVLTDRPRDRRIGNDERGVRTTSVVFADGWEYRTPPM